VLSAVLPGVPGGLQGDLFAQIAIGAARGAVIGGVTAAIAGGDIGQGALWGAGTGAIIGFAGSQQFQNLLGGNGFRNNAEVAEQQLKGDIQKVATAQKTDAERPLAHNEKQSTSTNQAEASAKSLKVNTISTPGLPKAFETKQESVWNMFWKTLWQQIKEQLTDPESPKDNSLKEWSRYICEWYDRLSNWI
jgi:outer membrane lipoprotein SlyB